MVLVPFMFILMINGINIVLFCKAQLQLASYLPLMQGASLNIDHSCGPHFAHLY